MKYQKIFLIFGIFILFISQTTQIKLDKTRLQSLFTALKSESSRRRRREDNGETPKEEAAKDSQENSDNLEGWLTIQSDSFFNSKVSTPEQKLSIEISTNRRRNTEFEMAKEEGAKTKYDFYFYLKNGYIYYYNTKGSKHLIEAIVIKNAGNAGNEECFKVTSFYNYDYTICAQNRQDKLKWLCKIEEIIKANLEPECTELNPLLVNNATAPQESQIETIKLAQKVIYIPKPSRRCNEGWNYRSNGNDWECICKEGLEQSPIDIPRYTPLNDTAPSFVYSKVKGPSYKPDEKHSFDFKISEVGDVINKDNNAKSYKKEGVDAFQSLTPTEVKSGDIIIVNEDDTIKVKFFKTHNQLNSNFGQIIMPSGDVFYATEIHFKTPSEHTLQGRRYEMEMQVIHRGDENTNPNEQAVLCFLFGSKPGVFNKFLDSLNAYDLPNRVDRMKIVTSQVFIPDIFVELNDESEGISPGTMPPFSFYSYNGSLTAPPCTERTTVYVAKKVIPISSVIYGLFKEALNVPPSIDMTTGSLIENTEDRINDNTRVIQPINQRVVYLYDHEQFGCGGYDKPKKKEQQGHYEKRPVTKQEIIFVSGDKPTGFPGSFVVPDDVINQ